MKRFKSMIIIALCCILVLGLVACVSNKPYSNDVNITDSADKAAPEIKKEDIFTVEEAKQAVEEFCRRPNIGVQASYLEEFDSHGTNLYSNQSK